MSSTKTVFIMNKDPQTEDNKQKIQQNTLDIQNLSNSDNLISVDKKIDLPYNVKEGTYAFVKDMENGNYPSGMPVHFHNGAWYDFCCNTDKDAVINRELKMIVVYAPVQEDLFLTELNSVNNFRNIKKNDELYDVSDSGALSVFLKSFYQKYTNILPWEKIEIKQWNNNTPYGQNDLVKHSATFYKSTIENNSTEPSTGGSEWTEIQIEEWTQNASYSESIVVRYKNAYYNSKENNNVDNKPLTVGLYVTNNLSGINTNDYSISDNKIYAILPPLDGHSLPSISDVASYTDLSLLQGEYVNDADRNDKVMLDNEFIDGESGAVKLDYYIKGSKSEQTLTFVLENSAGTVGQSYGIPAQTNQNETITHTLDTSMLQTKLDQESPVLSASSFVKIENNQIEFLKPVPKGFVSVSMSAISNDYHNGFSSVNELYTFEETNVGDNKTNQELQTLKQNNYNDTNSVLKHDDKMIYFDGTDFKYLYNDVLVLQSSQKIKVIVKWDDMGLTNEEYDLAIPTFEQDLTLPSPLPETKSVTFTGGISKSADIEEYLYTLSPVDANPVYSVSLVNNQLKIENSHLLIDENNEDEVLLTITLTPTFSINFGNGDVSELDQVVKNWTINDISPEFFTFDGLTDASNNGSGIFKKVDENVNFPWDVTGVWEFEDVVDMSGMFLGHVPSDFTNEEKLAITNWYINNTIMDNIDLSNGVPSGSLLEDLVEITERVVGPIENNFDKISWAWGKLLSQIDEYSDITWNVKNVSSIYEKVARYLLGGEYMNGYNFGSIENWDVSDVTDMEGLFGVTESYIDVKRNGDSNPDANMKSALTIIKNDATNGITYDELRTLLIQKLSTFNKDLSKWDVSNVTNFYRTFYHLPSYNQPWSWTYEPNNHPGNFKEMFRGASSMSHDIEFTDLVGSYPEQTTRSIQVSKYMDVMTGTNASLIVNDFTKLLDGFNPSEQDVSDYIHNNATIRYYVALDISKDLTTEDNNGNKIINHREDIGAPNNWKTQNVTSIHSLFKSTKFNKEINDWDVGNVTTMSQAFERNSVFNQELNKWDTSKVKSMYGMFWFCNFNKNIGDWDTSRVENMGFMFRASGMQDGDIYKWDLSSLNTMYQIFSHHNSFNPITLQSLTDEWNSAATYKEGDIVLVVDNSSANDHKLYKSLKNENTDLTSVNTSWELLQFDNVKNYSYGDVVYESGKTFVFKAKTPPVWAENNDYWKGKIVLDSVNNEYYKLKHSRLRFHNTPPSSFTYDETTNLSTNGYWEKLDRNIPGAETNFVNELWKQMDKEELLIGWDRTFNKTLPINYIIKMEDSGKFYRTTEPKVSRDIEIQDNSGKWEEISDYDSNVSYVLGDFVAYSGVVYQAKNNVSGGDTPNIDTSNWSSKSSVNWKNVLSNNIPRPGVAEMFVRAYAFNRPMDKLNTKGIKSFKSVFYLAYAFNHPLPWDTSDATTMAEMFYSAVNFNSPISFDTKKVTNMDSMFYDARNFNQEVEFDTSSVITMNNMFNRAYKFNKPVNFDVSRVTDFSGMFRKAYAFNQDLSSWVKSGEASISKVDLLSVNPNRRVFVQDVHSEENKNRRYVVIEKTNTGFKAMLFENESIRLENSVSDNSANIDDVSVYFDRELENTDLVFIHYGKRIDIHMLTDYQVWKEGKSYPMGTILYNSTYNKHYKALKTTSGTWNSLEWIEYTQSNDTVHTDILNGFYPSPLKDEVLHFFGHYTDYNKDYLLFGSESYVYSFKVENSFADSSLTLSLSYHNNRGILAEDENNNLLRRGMITGPIYFIDNKYLTSDQNTDKFTRERIIDVMQQKLMSVSMTGDHFFTALYRRYTLPEHDSNNSYSENTLLLENSDYKRVDAVGALEDAQFVLDKTYSTGTRCVSSDGAGVLRMYESSEPVEMSPGNNLLWEINPSDTSNSQIYDANVFTYNSNVIVNHEDNYYQASTDIYKNVPVVDAKWNELPTSAWSQQSYSKDSYVVHNSDTLYKSFVDNNTIEPGVTLDSNDVPLSDESKVFVQGVHSESNDVKRFVVITKISGGFQTRLYENQILESEHNKTVTLSGDIEKMFSELHVSFVSAKNLMIVHYGPRVDIHVLNSSPVIIHEDIFADHMSKIDNEWVKYVGYYNHHSTRLYFLFKSNKYVYNFKINGDFNTANNITVVPNYHNNPNVSSNYRGMIKEYEKWESGQTYPQNKQVSYQNKHYKSMVVETSTSWVESEWSEITVSNINRYHSHATRDKEGKEDLMEQELLACKFRGGNFFVSMYRRFRLPLVNEWSSSTAYSVGSGVTYDGKAYKALNSISNSNPNPNPNPKNDTTNWALITKGAIVVTSSGEHQRVKQDDTLENANYVLQDYAPGSLCIFEDESGTKNIYKTEGGVTFDSQISLEYPLNTIVKNNDSYYKTKSVVKRNIAVNNQESWEELTTPSWSLGTSYDKDDYIVYSNKLYQSLYNANSIEPETQPDSNNELVSEVWQSKVYAKDDIVFKTDENKYYVALVATSSSFDETEWEEITIVDRRIFVQNVHSDSGNTKRYTIMYRTGTGFYTRIYENDSVVFTKRVDVDTNDAYSMDELHVKYDSKIVSSNMSVFVHYGKRVDVYIISNTGSVIEHEDLFSGLQSHINNERVKYIGYTYHRSHRLFFHSSKYVYAFSKNSSFQLAAQHHNNPHVTSGVFRGKITGSVNNYNNAHGYRLQDWSVYTSEQKTDMSVLSNEQKLLHCQNMGSNFVLSLYRRYKSFEKWDVSKSYATGDIIYHDNKIYKSNTDINVNGGNNQNPSLDTTNWTHPVSLQNKAVRIYDDINQTIEYKKVSADYTLGVLVEFSSSSVYSNHDITLYNNKLYQSTSDNNVSVPGSSSATWQILNDDDILSKSVDTFLTGIYYFEGNGHWAEFVLISSNSPSYLVRNSMTSSEFVSEEWSSLDFEGVWQQGTSYVENKYVKHENKLYKAVVATTSSGSFITSDWVEIAFNTWNIGSSYFTNDIVEHDNGFFIANKKQDQENMLNKTADDLPNWISFVNNLSVMSKIKFSKTDTMGSGSNRIVISMLDKNKDVSVIQITKIFVSNGGYNNRFIYIHSSNTSQLKYVNRVIDTTNVINVDPANELSSTYLPDIHYDIRYKGKNNDDDGDILIYGISQDNEKISVFRLEDVVVNRELQQQNISLYYNRFTFDYDVDGVDFAVSNSNVTNIDLYATGLHNNENNVSFKGVESLRFSLNSWQEIAFKTWGLFDDDVTVASSFNPNTSSGWKEIKVNDNKDENDIEMFATCTHTWPANTLWMEFVLISTDSPSYDTLNAHYDEETNSLNTSTSQSQKHILNTREDDLDNWKTFCSTLPNEQSVAFAHAGDSIFIYAINNENKVNILQFTSLKPEHNSGTNRYVVIDKLNSQILLQTIDFSEQDVRNEADSFIEFDTTFKLKLNNENMYVHGNKSDQSHVYLLKDVIENDNAQAPTEIVYNNFDTPNYTDTKLVIGSTNELDFDLYTTKLDNFNFKQIKLFRFSQWKALSYVDWNENIFNEGDVVEYNSVHYKAKQNINGSTLNPDNSPQWTEVNVLDNNGHYNTEVFATSTQAWPNHKIWAEFKLISTNSPLSNQEHILNTRESDKTEWDSFIDSLDNETKVHIQDYNNSVLLFALDKNDKMRVLQFTSLYEENGSGYNRYIVSDKNVSQLLLYVSNIEENNVLVEADTFEQFNNNFHLKFEDESMYVYGQKENKVHLFKIDNLFSEDNLLQNNVNVMYNNFEQSDSSIDMKIVLNDIEKMDPDIYVLEENELNVRHMKSFNTYSAENMEEMFENAISFSNNGIKYYYKSNEQDLLKEIEFIAPSLWNSSISYILHDLVLYGDELYVAVKNSSNQAPHNQHRQVNSEFWKVYDGKIHNLTYVLLEDNSEHKYSSLTDEDKLWISVDGGVTTQRVPNVVNNPHGALSKLYTNNVTDMREMFKGATLLFLNIANWNVLHVTDNSLFSNENNHITEPVFNKVNRTGRDNLLEAMFHLLTDPNGYESTFGHVSDWVLSSNITDLSNLTDIQTLRGAVEQSLSDQFTDSHIQSNIEAFNESLSEWDVSHVLNFSNMLKGCSTFKNGHNSFDAQIGSNDQLGKRWNIHRQANLSNMFDGCVVYMDDITPFFYSKKNGVLTLRKPNDEDLFNPHENWRNVSINAPYVYFVPDAVTNIQLVLNEDTSQSGNFKLLWDHGSFVPSNAEYSITHIKPDNTESSETLGINVREKVFNLIEEGEHKFKLKGKGYIDTGNGDRRTDDFSPEISKTFTINQTGGTFSTTTTTEYNLNFTDNGSTVDYLWNYRVIETVSGGVGIDTVKTNTLQSTSVTPINEAMQSDIYGFSIDFASGNAMSYVKLQNDKIKFYIDGNTLSTSPTEIGSGLVNSGASRNDLSKYNTAIYKNTNDNSEYVLLKNDLVLTLYKHQNGVSPTVTSNVPIGNYYNIGTEEVVTSDNNSNVHSLSQIGNISISETHISVVAHYGAYQVLYVFSYDSSGIDGNTYFHESGISIAQLYSNGAQNGSLKMAVIKTNDDIYVYEKATGIETWGSNIVVDNVINAITIHFENENTLSVGLIENNPVTINF